MSEQLCNEDLVTPEEVGFRNGMAFPLRKNIFTSGKEYQARLQQRFKHDISNSAVHRLKQTQPQHSAAGTLSLTQTLLMLVFTAIFSISLIKYPLITIVVANTFITVYFLLAIIFRLVLLIAGSGLSRKRNFSSSIPAHELPTITILLPLYRDAESLASLSAAINALDYPQNKKDVKLLLEEDDDHTITEARRLGLHEQFELIQIPGEGPRTKPKACNHGMQLARGELIVIFDAEDQPEQDQLLKAAEAFKEASPKLACVQARLNYYNADDNWLTRLFTLEYSLWFDWLLPGLQRLGAPIPLGGTSNYFKTDTLFEAGGWDPYNVTEDADLGLRLSKLGYRVKLLDSTTFEEANCKTGNWVRQRSRWMKGYLQTWFVHMRRPGDIVNTTGWLGLLSVQLFIAGNVLSALINPILWAVFVTWLLTSSQAISAAFPGPLLALNIFALTAGNLFFVLLAVIAPLKRGWAQLSPYGLTAPAYWMLTSLAAYKALWQIIFPPSLLGKNGPPFKRRRKAKTKKRLGASMK